MNTDFFEDLERIAGEMDRTRERANAEIGYSLLSDALVWSDEYPAPDTIAGRPEFDCVRLLLRYRTTLLLGAPDEQFRAYWEHAQTLFPHWAGFCQARLTPTEDLRRMYDKRRQRDMRLLERIDKLCARSRHNLDGRSRRGDGP